MKVVIRPAAEADLNALFDYLASETSVRTAERFVTRVTDACASLETFPNRGAPRGDIQPGLRILGFERRVTIAFRVLDGKVDIVRILYRGRDVASDLESMPSDG